MDGWNEIYHKSVGGKKRQEKKRNAGWKAAVRGSTFTGDTNPEQRRERGGGAGEGGWPSVRKLEAMKHYARIMKMVLLGHTPH